MGSATTATGYWAWAKGAKRRKLSKKRSLVFILFFDANRFGMGNGGDTVGGGAGNGDRQVTDLGRRRLRLFLEVLHHPILLFDRVAASEVVTGFVIAGPFRAGWVGTGAMRQNEGGQNKEVESGFHGVWVGRGVVTSEMWRNVPQSGGCTVGE